MRHRPPASAICRGNTGKTASSRNDTHTLLAYPDSRFVGAKRNKAANPSRSPCADQELPHKKPAIRRDWKTAPCTPIKYGMQDIAELIGRERVAHVVQVFYGRIRQHPTLSKPFASVHDWPGHEAVLAHFWWVSLGGERYLDYSYAVARKHLDAGFTPALLAEWLALFREVLQAELPEELAVGWIKRAELIGESLTHMHAVQTRGAPINPRLFRPA